MLTVIALADVITARAASRAAESIAALAAVRLTTFARLRLLLLLR